MNQIIIYFTLILLLVLFLWDRIRYDFVALIGLFIISITGVIPINSAFLGFSNPAVVTVVSVMIISRGMQQSGLLDMIVRKLNWFGSKPISLIFPLSIFTTIASAFMNNVSVIMPISIKLTKKRKQSPSLILMPLAYATLLGGMLTLVGSSPNIIVSSIRKESFGASFQLFDFFKVAIFLVILGTLYLSLIGWRFLPKKKSPVKLEETTKVEDYCTELLVHKESKLIGTTLKDISVSNLYQVDIIGIIRYHKYLHHISLNEKVELYDILMIKADAEDLKSFIEGNNLMLMTEDLPIIDELKDKNISMIEVVVMKDSPIINKTAFDLKLREKYDIALLAKTSHRSQVTKRIYQQKFSAGDVLLIQGNTVRLPEQIVDLGCMALTEPGSMLADPKKMITYSVLFGLGVALVTFGVLPVHIAFPLTALLMVLLNVIPYRDVYKAVDWSVIVMIGSLIPLGRAMTASGAADHISKLLLSITSFSAPWFIVGIILLLTMLVTNLLHNATAAIILAPVALEIAKAQAISPDLYLMTVAIGACSAFLTPIGHQSNTLVMGPGGYSYGDYWKVGWGLMLINLFVGVPLLLHFWG
ncbi:SLC13 family permease [bacterium]|nr:SLC13 family permease [bacterium]